MKIRSVRINNRKRSLELISRSGKVYPFPYAKLEPRPTRRNRIRKAYVDEELGREAVTYALDSGEEGSVHIDHALEYNEDPRILADLLIHRLAVEAKRRMEMSGISRRELARRLRTSVPQLYRLLGPATTRKRMGQLVSLLHLLDCDVKLVVKTRRAA